MNEWLKIQDKNGDTYLVNSGDITCISKDGIEFRSGRRFFVPLDVEWVDRLIAETRKGFNRSEQERWLNGETN